MFAFFSIGVPFSNFLFFILHFILSAKLERAQFYQRADASVCYLWITKPCRGIQDFRELQSFCFSSIYQSPIYHPSTPTQNILLTQRHILHEHTCANMHATPLFCIFLYSCKGVVFAGKLSGKKLLGSQLALLHKKRCFWFYSWRCHREKDCRSILMPRFWCWKTEI